MEIMFAVRLRIRELQEEHGLSVNALAALCGISQSTLQHIVSGQRDTVSVATIQKLCDGLGMDITAFFQTEAFHKAEMELW